MARNGAQFFVAFCAVVGMGAATQKASLPTATVLVMYNSDGEWAYISDTRTVALKWKSLLADKVKHDHSWPFNATIELFDVKSNMTRASQYLTQRFADAVSGKKPPVTAMVPAETNLPGALAAEYGARYGVPVVAAVLNPDPVNPTVPQVSDPTFNTTFLIEPPAQYQFRELISAYEASGVRTVVAVAMYNKFDTYNADSCFAAATLAATRGMVVQDQILIYPNATHAQLVATVKAIQRRHRPDAILWCDWAACALEDHIKTQNALPAFKEANYLPKTLALLDCLDHPNMDSYVQQGLFDYVAAGEFISGKLLGQDYTEDNTPYASHFRPNNTVSSVAEALNLGSTRASPSSTKLFLDWYLGETGATASYQTAMTWAAFDLLESAIYRAVTGAGPDSHHRVPPGRVLEALRSSQAATPIGRVVFDGLRVNSAQTSIVVQAQPSSVPGATAEIVFPSGQRTAPFIYPMPTWDERVYTWALIKDVNSAVSVAVAAFASTVILAVAITVTVHRQYPDIRMLHHGHVVAMCVAGIAVCWGLALLWQADITQAQCDAAPWVIFVPASFLVHINNLKAYRLSIFLRANGRKPKPFTHQHVLRYALALTLVTAAVVALAVGVDRPKRTRFVADPVRPSLDEYHCVTSGAYPALLYVLLAFHVGTSAVCIASVRNGSEAFKDGVLFKEAFVVLYACVAVTFVLSALQLPAPLLYTLRTCFVALGVLLFILRILFSRCHRHWIPATVNHAAAALVNNYIRPAVAYLLPTPVVLDDLEGGDDKGRRRTSTVNVEDEEAGPAYILEVPQDDSIGEMIEVIMDAERGPILYAVAESTLTTENIEFIRAVIAYEAHAAELLVAASGHASDSLKPAAAAVYEAYIKQNCDNEVNVCAATRSKVEKALAEWALKVPAMTHLEAKRAWAADKLQRAGMYEVALKEISVMTYQNLWNKFRAAEAANMALNEGRTSGKNSGKVFVA